MYSLLVTVLAGLFFLIGVLIAIFCKSNKNLVNFSIGMSFSVLIILVLLDILPDCFNLFTDYAYLSITGGILVGFGILLLLEKFVPDHLPENTKVVNVNNLKHIGIMTSVALIIHNFVEGISIYGVSLSSLKVGLIYAIGVGFHNIPFGISIFSVFKDKKQMWIYTTLLTISTFIGGLIIYVFNLNISNFILGTLLSITIGMIIYIVFVELLMEMRDKFNKYSLYGILIGIVLMMIGELI